MATKTIWGLIDKQGRIMSGSGGYRVDKEVSQPGLYKITFDEEFLDLPAITGNQVNFESLEQDPRDGVVFPVLDRYSVKVIVGKSTGTHEEREFSFIAIGNVK